jgi:diacylglycerol kinase family enzyme
MTGPCCVIVNLLAGGGRSLGPVRRELGRLGLAHRVAETRDLAHARALAREAARGGELAVAFGGDGLIGAVADAPRGTEGVMAVLPGGRGNDFVRSLGSGYTVAAANSPSYGGGMQLAPAADLSDGQLDVVVIHELSRSFEVYADGEPIAELPVRIAVLPGAMRVLVPEPVPRRDTLAHTGETAARG